MLRCMTSAIAGLKANMTGLDVTGNNVSNVNTGAFKSSSISFRDSMYQQLRGGSAGSTDAAGMNPSQIGYGSTASSVDVNSTAGSPDATGNPDDIYIGGSGYLIVGKGTKKTVTKDPVTGDMVTPTTDSFDGLKYTRLCKLSWDSNGYLTDGDGNYVCGYVNTMADMGTPATYGKVLQALRQPVTAAVAPATQDTVHAVSNMSIAADGTITCNDGGKSVVLGKIMLANVTNPGGMQQTGDSFYEATANAGTVTVVDPGANGTNSLTTGALEASNVDLATEFSNMIMFERGYQANTKIVTVADECLQTLVNMK